MLALWELDWIHHLILYSHCTAVRQNSYGHYQAGKRMEPDTYTEVSVFYHLLGAICWALLHKSIQRKYKLAHFRYFFAGLIFHDIYLPA